MPSAAVLVWGLIRTGPRSAPAPPAGRRASSGTAARCAAAQSAGCRRHADADVLAPVAQPRLTDAARREHRERGVFVVPHDAQAVRDPLVILVRLAHRTGFDAEQHAGVGAFQRDAGEKAARRRVHDPAPPQPVGKRFWINAMAVSYIFASISAQRVAESTAKSLLRARSECKSKGARPPPGEDGAQRPVFL